MFGEGSDSLWQFLHHLPRVDFSFSSVTNDLVVPRHLSEIWRLSHNNHYQQSIQMFALIPTAIGMIIFVVGFISICYNYCCASHKHNGNGWQKLSDENKSASCCACCASSSKKQLAHRPRFSSDCDSRQRGRAQKHILSDDSQFSNYGIESPPQPMREGVIVRIKPLKNGLNSFDMSGASRNNKYLNHFASISEAKQQQVQRQRQQQRDADNKERATTMPTMIGTRKLVCCRACVLLIIIIAIGVSVYFGYELDQTIIKVQDDWDHSYEPYDVAITYAQTVERYINNGILQCELILKTPDAAPIYPLVNITEQALFEALHDMQHYLGYGQKIVWGDSKQIDPYRKYAIFAGLFILGLCSMLFMFSACVSFINNNRSRNGSRRCRLLPLLLSVLLALGMISVWSISVWQFAFSVQASDACDNPQSAIEQTAQHKFAKELSVNITMEIVQYYIYCDYEHRHNPLEILATEAYTDLLSVNKTVAKLVNSSAAQHMGIVNETTQLYWDYTQAMNEIYIINESLDCAAFSPYLNDITHNLCHDGMENWFLLYIAQALIVLLFIFSFLFNCILFSKNAHNTDWKHKNRTKVEEQLAQYLNADGSGAGGGGGGGDGGGYDRMQEHRASMASTYTDRDIRKCIEYLLPYIDDFDEMHEKADALTQSGYPDAKGGRPLHDKLVGKAIAILRNYDRTVHSDHQHPLLDGLI